MKLNRALVFWLATSLAVAAKDSPQVRDFDLDEHVVYSIPVSTARVTTISFPGPISAIDGAHVTIDSKTPGMFQIAHTKGSYFFSARALAKKVTTNINVRWNKRTYVIELIEDTAPLYSVIFCLPAEKSGYQPARPVTPNRLLGLLDKAKAFPLLKLHHPESVAQVDFVAYSKALKSSDFKDYEIQIDEIFRFNTEDTLVFHVTLRNKTNRSIAYRPNGFSVRAGNRAYPQSISDASGVIPPGSEAPVYFAITGTPNGGRNELSLKNDFTILLSRIEPEAEPKPDSHEPAQRD